DKIRVGEDRPDDIAHSQVQIALGESMLGRLGRGIWNGIPKGAVARHKKISCIHLAGPAVRPRCRSYQNKAHPVGTYLLMRNKPAVSYEREVTKSMPMADRDVLNPTDHCFAAVQTAELDSKPSHLCSLTRFYGCMPWRSSTS